MSNPSRLDLTGQASEDEPASRSSKQQPLPHRARHDEQSRHREPSQSLQTTTKHNPPSANTNNDKSTNNLSNNTSRREGVLKYLPSPIDLWQSRTPASLLQLPLVFMIFVILQLPLHYNSTTDNAATVNSLSKNEWQGRVKVVDKLSNELNEVEKDLDDVKGGQAEIKGMVGSLRRRLGKIEERRNARENYLLRMQEKESIEREQVEKKQQGMAKDKPISTVSMATAIKVATFAGKANADGLTKKAD